MLHEMTTLCCSFGVGEYMQKNLVLRPRAPQDGSWCIFAKSLEAEPCYAGLPLLGGLQTPITATHFFFSAASPETIPGLEKILGQSLAVRPSHWESGITGLQVWGGGGEKLGVSSVIISHLCLFYQLNFGPTPFIFPRLRFLH